MGAKQNEASIRDFYTRLLSGDAEGAIRETMAADAVWENPLPAPIPYGGCFEGADGARRYLGLVLETLEIERFEIDEVIAARDRVVVLGSESARVRKTGRSYSGHWVHVIRFRGGKIAHLREYNDTAEMLSAFV